VLAHLLGDYLKHRHAHPRVGSPVLALGHN
jgi:hypothetical protein